jgi:hypothetical protein
MTKSLGWIGVLSLVCAGVSAGPVIEAQNRPNHRTGSNAGSFSSQRSSSIGRSPAPAASASKGSTNSREQHPDIKAQSQPSAAKLPLAGAAQQHPGAAPAQTPGVSQTQSPSTNQLFEENLHGMNSLVVSHGSGTQTQPSMSETFKTNSQNQTPPQNQTPTQSETSTQNQPPATFSTVEGKPSPPTNTQHRKPRNGTPLQPSTTITQNRKPWNQAPSGRPPTNGYIKPPDRPQPMTLPPFPGQQVLPANRNLQPEPAVSDSPGVATQPPPPGIAAPSGSQAEASSEGATKPSPHQETSKLDSSGAQKNRDEGKIANRPKPTPPAPHVGPVPSAVTKQPPSVEKKALFTASLASLAGAGFWVLHMLLNVTTGCRWDVPKVTVVGPQPYVSLSFVPDVGSAEERITFLKKKRRSG